MITNNFYVWVVWVLVILFKNFIGLIELDSHEKRYFGKNGNQIIEKSFYACYVGYVIVFCNEF